MSKKLEEKIALVSGLAELDKPYANIKEQHGRINVLFVNAGGGEFATIDQVTEEQFDRTFDTNVKGVFFTVQKGSGSV